MNKELHIYFKYTIITLEENARFIVRIINNNAPKNPRVAGFWFKTNEQRQAWIDAWKKRIDDREIEKTNRYLERAMFQNPAKVGDILYSSWGYEQTNIDFYEVVEVKNRQVVIRELKQDAEQTEWLQGICKPIPGQYAGDPMKKVVRPAYNTKEAYAVRIASYTDAYIWDGKPKHYTQYA